MSTDVGIEPAADKPLRQERIPLAIGYMVGAGVVFLAQIDSLRRYIRLRRISSGHPTPPGTMPAGADAPPRWGTSHWPVH